jgi:hypothetical protein
MASRFVLSALALALASAGAARAASDDDLAQIRREIQELKANYEARIQALEQRLKEAQARAPVAAPAPPPLPVAAAPTPGAIGNAFNPAMSVILQGRYANLSQDPASFAIAGFAPRGEVGPGARGFSLSESEVTLTANVDHKFAGALTVALTPEDTVAVEEAYATMLAPIHGMTPKFGRFLSGVGYLNEQHTHAWDFVDAPLPYQAFFGGQYRNDGVQVKWLAPTAHYVELGAEAGNGGAFPGGERGRNGIGSGAFYLHTGGDVGLGNNWRAGVSYLRTRSEEGVATHLAIADFVWKWAPNGNPRERNFKLQAEYFQQKQEEWKPKGAYVQAVYQFMPQWRVGARYDRLDPAGGVPSGDIFEAEPLTFKPRRASVMFDWSPSEFSRLRLQYSQSRTLADATDNQWFVQYVLSLGAHGAHKY